MEILSNLKVKAVIPNRNILGEGPVWDIEKKVICWVDIFKGEIHQYSPAKNEYTVLQLNQMIGSLAICDNGDFITALENGLAFVERKTGYVQMLVDPESHLPGNRFNDGKCDPHGRFWAGTMSLAEQPGAGGVYMLDKEYTVQKKIEGVTISNGMAWSLDHNTLYYIDTPSYGVAAYHYNEVNGNIRYKKMVFKVSEDDGFPDGMTIDSDGMLWIAHWDGWQVARWDPASGEKLLSLPLPVSRVTSCAFGGDDLTDLYITSASEGLSDEDLEKQPLAGSLFVVRNCGFQGVPSFLFKKNKSIDI